MKRIALIVAAVLLAALMFAVGSAVRESQRADYGWSPKVEKPAFTSTHPRVLADEAHNNASTAGIGGRYWPLGRLLRADGYHVRRNKSAFTAASLDGTQVLIVANASGAPKPQFLGINLPVRSHGDRNAPAFTPEEIEAVRAWVSRGGSLLLIADHAPFGAASRDLAAAFGVTMHAGFTEVPNELSDPLLFSRDNGRLGDHPILSGSGPETAVKRVMTFTGQSLDGPPEATVLLSLPESAIEYTPADTGFVEQPAGSAQGLAFEWGRGRVVILGEAAMLTAQVFRGERFGMNSPGNDNRRLALNIMHWLSRTL